MADLGRAALVVSLGLSVYALVAGATAAATNRRRLAASARNALYCSFASTLIAAVVLASALVRHDFSFTYVAQHTNRTLPTAYTLSARDGGTRFEYRNEFFPPLGIVGRVAQRAVAGNIPEVEARASLRRLQRLCESPLHH